MSIRKSSSLFTTICACNGCNAVRKCITKPAQEIICEYHGSSMRSMVPTMNVCYSCHNKFCQVCYTSRTTDERWNTLCKICHGLIEKQIPS